MPDKKEVHIDSDNYDYVTFTPGENTTPFAEIVS